MSVQVNIERLPIIQRGTLLIDPQLCVVELNGEKISLYPKEFDVLYLLMKYPGWVLSAEQIYQAVWEGELFESEHVVYNTICQIRKKLGKSDVIRTVKRRGYKFEINQ